jgi:hypothetical protein
MHKQSKNNLMIDTERNGQKKKKTYTSINTIFYNSTSIGSLASTSMQSDTQRLENGQHLFKLNHGYKSRRLWLGCQIIIYLVEKANNVWNSELYRS